MLIIDNKFTNTNKEYDQNYIHINDISDHFPLSIKNMFSKVNDITNNLNYYRTMVLCIDKNNITNLIDKLK